MAALDDGDLETATICLNVAKGLLIIAYEAVVPRERIRNLGTSARRGGRKVGNRDRTERPAAASASQAPEAALVALRLALMADPGPKAERRDVRDDTLLRRVARL